MSVLRIVKIATAYSLRNALLALADLKPKGNFLGTTPNIEYISEYLPNMCLNCKPQHVIPIDPRQYEKDLQETHV